MDLKTIKKDVPTTPAFLLDENAVIKTFENFARLKRQSGCRVLYSVKSLPLTAVLQWAMPFVDGFSVSSLFEARLAGEILNGAGSLHITTPGLRPDEINEIGGYCTHVSFNSLSQFELYSPLLPQPCSTGLRINPQLSFLNDRRYDPCARYSKLGVPITEMTKGIPPGVKGLHFHNMFAGTSLQPLVKTVKRIEHFLGRSLQQLEWINLGGGYLFESGFDDNDFIDLSTRLREKYRLQVFIEPGKAIVGKAGYLLATVIDVFSSDGKTVAVLDTSVNHNPEVFEFQKQAALVEEDPRGQYSAILAGSTCLAGDILGEYRFGKPLEIGERVAFKDVGAYSLIKANRFNGYNLPDVYSICEHRINKIKSYAYEQFREQWICD
ncbi:MAG: carboxynorspermidine decarboxylase [Gammaproteobacteria bacterium]